jgi:hypothetical protein
VSMPYGDLGPPRDVKEIRQLESRIVGLERTNESLVMQNNKLQSELQAAEAKATRYALYLSEVARQIDLVLAVTTEDES